MMMRMRTNSSAMVCVQPATRAGLDIVKAMHAVWALTGPDWHYSCSI